MQGASRWQGSPLAKRCNAADTLSRSNPEGLGAEGSKIALTGSLHPADLRSHNTGFNGSSCHKRTCPRLVSGTY